MKRKAYLILIVLLISMGALPLLSSDIYLPALPSITQHFGIAPVHIQSTLSLFLLGIGLAQLVYGPLSDSLGRKPTLLIGLLFYVVATIGCVFSTSALMLNGFRLLQGMGACAGTVMSKAIIADYFDAEESSEVYATVFPFIGSSPAIAPIIGGILITYFSWPSIFVCLFLMGLLLLISVIFFFKDGVIVPTEQKDTAKIRKKGMSFYFLMKNKSFVAYTLLVCLAYGAWFSYIINSAYVFQQYAISPFMMGFLYIPLSVTYFFGNYAAKRCLKKGDSLHKIVHKGMLIFTAGAMLLAFLPIMTHNIAVFILAMSVLVCGNGFLLPMATTGAMSASKQGKGSTSAWLGFLQLTSAALISYLSAHVALQHQYFIGFIILLMAALVWPFYYRWIYLRGIYSTASSPA